MKEDLENFSKKEIIELIKQVRNSSKDLSEKLKKIETRTALIVIIHYYKIK